MLKFSLYYEDSCIGIYEVLAKELPGRCVRVWEKQWEELNVHLGKVFVRIVYHLFRICALCHYGF